jgi:hydroxylamine dehydrogenase
MNKNSCSKKLHSTWMVVLLLVLLFFGWDYQLHSQDSNAFQFPTISVTTQQCIECHQEETPGIVMQWKQSVHYQKKVGCYECHQANSDDVDAFIHSDPETHISVIVSPKDCSECHEVVVEEFQHSSHFTAHNPVADSLGTLVGTFLFGNNDLKTAAFPHGASAADVNGCWKCHGSKIKLDTTGPQVKLDPATWPNKGIGRINPDGSKGSCSACHSGHQFSVTQARQPESCRACHTGDASIYEYEIYTQSKHGVNYTTFKDEMNLDTSSWIAGSSYYAAPTCASCHMTAAPYIKTTHNINSRIKDKSENMKLVCNACHSETLSGNFYIQAKSENTLINSKWIDPAKVLYCIATDLLKEMGNMEDGTALPKTKDMRTANSNYYLLTNPIDYTYMFMGQDASVARVAAFMMSPQYVEDMNKQLAAKWFGTFIPQIRELISQGKQDTITAHLADALEDSLNSRLSQPTYGNPLWPDVPLTDCKEE